MTNQVTSSRPHRTSRRSTRRTNQYFHHIPRVNISNATDAIRLELAIPGLNKENIAIRVENERLHISDKSESKSAKKYIKKGFDLSGFNRTFALSKDVDVEKIQASFEAGILTVALPIKEAAKPKSITIS